MTLAPARNARTFSAPSAGSRYRRRVRILVVEDEPAIGAAVAGAIRAEGHAVDVVADGDEAIRWATAYPNDLLVLDVRLPGTDGSTVCRRIRAAGSDISILMLSRHRRTMPGAEYPPQRTIAP